MSPSDRIRKCILGFSFAVACVLLIGNLVQPAVHVSAQSCSGGCDVQNGIYEGFCQTEQGGCYCYYDDGGFAGTYNCGG
jgi:hypothetical protein